jgi:hypothetical protein
MLHLQLRRFSEITAVAISQAAVAISQAVAPL